MCRVDDRHVRLEREFEADRARKDRETEKERRRDRKLAEDAMRQVRAAESDAARERNRRQQRLAELRDRRQHHLKQVCCELLICPVETPNVTPTIQYSSFYASLEAAWFLTANLHRTLPIISVAVVEYLAACVLIGCEC